MQRFFDGRKGLLFNFWHVKQAVGHQSWWKPKKALLLTSSIYFHCQRKIEKPFMTIWNETRFLDKCFKAHCREKIWKFWARTIHYTSGHKIPIKMEPTELIKHSDSHWLGNLVLYRDGWNLEIFKDFHGAWLWNVSWKRSSLFFIVVPRQAILFQTEDTFGRLQSKSAKSSVSLIKLSKAWSESV